MAGVSVTGLAPRITTPFRGVRAEDAGLGIVAVDLGYSASKPTCGIAWAANETGCEEMFGAAIERVASILAQVGSGLLVIEAVLSTYHDATGNPDIRGDFERGRGWYYGPGAVSAIAAQRFLQSLANKLPEKFQPIPIAEAFLSFKKTRTRHSDDAAAILRGFSQPRPERLRIGTEPLSNLVLDVPEVRVFKASD